MEEMHEKILIDTMDLFLKYGIRSITMDDVARELGISKKTLYKHVSNKADLVDQCVKAKFKFINSAISGFASEVENAIDELFAIDTFFDEMMAQNHPAVMFQLSKYYADTYKWLDKSKDEFVMQITLSNLEKGVKQGLYRTDINDEYISYIYMAHTHLMSGETNVPQEVCESASFHRAHLEYHIRGIASASGLQYLNEKLKHKK